MKKTDFNTILAAVLIAGIVASLSGFISRKLVHPHKLDENAVKIEGVETVASSVSSAPEFADPILHLIATADLEKGQKISRACAACHSFNEGGPNGVGPNLWNTINNKKGHEPSYSYSDALLAMGGEWTYANLNQFFWKPKKYMPGTKMNYIGLKKPEDRAAIIAWLREETSPSAPLPTEADIAAEKAQYAPEPKQDPQVQLDEVPLDDAAISDDVEGVVVE